ncbi:SigE family RNA polymerase sigma factor [Streptomyces sp. LP05-1]|uniref:SigE family RNA polymerase sigma factor n=1 Tax=Streptomyces pyxinae TaxID=2970734 RepID=A0ABT2CLZ2_9ACTN|nr:SigE family RNA polymerase sigma factor [Streptomyces sp. LP05-1]MCS0638271.1 SigE family RNA polymerase sigma factor [Streptomyces sp. LP05-1]
MTDEEFAVFYGHTVRRLTGQLYVMTGDFHEAQDVVQEAFVRAWDRRHRLRQGPGPEAWVRTVARRLAVSRWRRVLRGRQLGRRSTAATSVEGPDPGMVDIAAALRRLPLRQRHCAALFYVCDLSVEAVAAETGLAVGTVKSHLSRARATLTSYLAPQVHSAEAHDG